MDISGMKGGLVGQSETNVKNALKLVDAIAPVVIVWDEIEKAIGGYKSSSMTDSGVTLGIVGQLLTWMQERKSATFIVATTNDVTAIPPEMMRRFDEQFFFDFPTLQEREEIARIHLELLNCNVDVARMVAENTAEWTGAEIEKLIKSAARRTKRKITGGAIVDAQRYIKPISVVRKEEVDKLCEWGRKSLRIANG
jgi:SpoVK/Ycf46/Vps4 family AAA+-type ATPase